MITRKSAFLILFIGTVILVSMTLLMHTRNCRDRETSMPQIPLYSDSILRDEKIPFDYSSGKIVNRQYEVIAPPQDVIQFYKNFSLCSENALDNKIKCGGKAEPFGSFTVWIDISYIDQTAYTVEIGWDKCGDSEGVSFDNP